MPEALGALYAALGLALTQKAICARRQFDHNSAFTKLMKQG